MSPLSRCPPTQADMDKFRSEKVDKLTSSIISDPRGIHDDVKGKKGKRKHEEVACNSPQMQPTLELTPEFTPNVIKFKADNLANMKYPSYPSTILNPVRNIRELLIEHFIDHYSFKCLLLAASSVWLRFVCFNAREPKTRMRSCNVRWCPFASSFTQIQFGEYCVGHVGTQTCAGLCVMTLSIFVHLAPSEYVVTYISVDGGTEMGA